MAEELCNRTLALYKPGVKMGGVHCKYSWSGKMPCTGRLVYPLCGQEKKGQHDDKNL